MKAVCLAAIVLATLAVGACAAPQEKPTVSTGPTVGLAARYQGDTGLAADPAVIFADDFESWRGDAPPAGVWDPVKREGTQRVRIVPGKLAPSGPGGHVLEVACWQEGDHDISSGLSKRLGNYADNDRDLGLGYEEVWVRYYQKFDEDYTPGVANHGSLLGGRDLSQPGARWVGMADTRDVAAQGYYSDNLQPYGGKDGKPFHWGFYSYHMDKPGRWGDYFPPQKMATIELGRWYCLEWRLKLNSIDPLAADGVEELWVDGVLSIRKTDLRYRRVPGLRITFFNLGTYYHPGLPARYTAEHPIKLYYDNLVIARERVGPIHVAAK